MQATIAPRFRWLASRSTCHAARPQVETAQARAAKEELEDQLRTATQQLKDAKAEQQFVLEEMETARKQVAAKEAELKAAQEAAATAAGKWHELELPMYPPVVRKEIREMSLAEQERYANAVDKMMESEDGVPGSSQFFRLASYHGGCTTASGAPVVCPRSISHVYG
jgi:chromosome segregation ATPase|eukprot:COSAG06_NODE_2157_length_7451_cov_7.096572_7_plen_167_part_00